MCVQQRDTGRETLNPRCSCRRNGVLFFLAFLAVAVLAVPQPALALRAVLISDTQGSKGPNYDFINKTETEAVNKAILAMNPKPDMVFCLGDLAGRGFTEETGYQFEAWKELMRPITDAGIPLYVIKGNHELTRARNADDPSKLRYFTSNQEAFLKAFSSMPSNGPKGYEHLAYTVSDKKTKTVFVAIDSYYLEKDLESKPYGAYGHISQGQLDWLAGPLPEVEEASHRILLAHAPVFNPKKERPIPHDESFKSLWRTLEDKHFDLMIAAHLHISSFALVDGKVWPEARYPMAQVIIGPVGGNKSSAAKVLSDPAVWNVSVDRNFLVVDIAGAEPQDPITLTTYAKTPEGYKAERPRTLTGQRGAGK